MDLDPRFYNETHFGELITNVYESPLYMDKYIDEYFIQSGKIRTDRLYNEFIKNSNRYCADTANSSVENEETRVVFEERIKSLIHTLKHPIKQRKISNWEKFKNNRHIKWASEPENTWKVITVILSSTIAICLAVIAKR